MFAVLLLTLGGFLVGGAGAAWHANRLLSVVLGVMALMAVTSGVLRMV